MLRKKGAAEEEAKGPGRRMSRPQIIHSGHFMVSEPHVDPDPDPDPAVALNAACQGVPGRPGPGPGPCVARRVRRSGPVEAAGAGEADDDDDDGSQRGSYDFDTVNQGTCLVYRYGPRSSGALNIDASLTKLFECLTLAYSGKILSPKWKTFKGLKLLQRDKIRLNNAIWRAWYLQYVEKRQNPVCSFVTPLEYCDVDDHRTPEAVILEGKYWKCQMGVVIREYHKWRTYYRIQAPKKREKPVCGSTQSGQEVADDVPSLEQNDEAAGGCPMELDPLDDLDALLDTIFSSRNPYGGPNLRGLAHQGNADMIQPTLTQLHPVFGEEFMDTLDPIHDFISSCRPYPAVQAPILQTDAAAAMGQCDPDVSPIAAGIKELPASGDSVIPIPITLDVEPPTPLNGQQTFLPLFPTSPLRISPPPVCPILHIQPQTTLLFSVITHTGSEKASLPDPSTCGGPFVVPASAPQAKSGRCRPLQRIAPAPSSSHQLVSPSTSLTHLLAPGPAPLPLTSVTNSAQLCDTTKLPATATRSSASEMKKYPLHASATLSSGAGIRFKEMAEDNPQVTNKPFTAKGSRRSTFTSADYARRMNISSSFNTLASLVLPTSDQTSAKLSKAMLLQKSVAYVGRLQHERRQAQVTVEALRSEIEQLSTAIDEFQRQLPPSGVPVLLPQLDQASQLYEEYVRQRTLQDWRFWLLQFSMVIKPLFESYTRTVSTSNLKEFSQSVLNWLEQHCTLPILRPAMSGSLLQLSKITTILTQPAQLPEQALQAVSCPPQCKSNS